MIDGLKNGPTVAIPGTFTLNVRLLNSILDIHRLTSNPGNPIVVKVLLNDFVVDKERPVSSSIRALRLFATALKNPVFIKSTAFPKTVVELLTVISPSTISIVPLTEQFLHLTASDSDMEPTLYSCEYNLKVSFPVMFRLLVVYLENCLV